MKVGVRAIAAAFGAVIVICALAGCQQTPQCDVCRPQNPVHITSGPPPNGTVGVSYASGGFPLSATGGPGWFTWNWAAAPGSQLPPGLRLQLFVLTPPGQGNQAAIQGVPTTAGTYKVIITVTGFQTPQQESIIYPITIAP